MNSEFSPRWSRYAFMTENDKELCRWSPNNCLTCLSSKTCPFDNCAGLILEYFFTLNVNRRNGSVWHALNGPDTWSSPTISPSTPPSARSVRIIRQLSKCRVMVSRRCGHWRMAFSPTRNAKDTSHRCDGQNIRISWRTQAFCFEKSVKPLMVPIPTLPVVPSFEVESMCFRPPRRPSKHRRRGLSDTPRHPSHRLVSPVVSCHIRTDHGRHPSETMS